LQAKAGGKRVAAFGEMVALLWAEGKHDAAIRLEQLWNDADKSRLCSLVCAYPLSGFDREKHARMFFSICGEHTDVVPVEGYALAQGQKRRAMARMQQRNQALEREIELSRERISLLQSSTEAGTWEMDLLDDTVTFSSKAAGILGLHATQMSVQQFTGLIAYSGDRDGFNEAIRRSRVGRKQFVTEFRVRRKNNEVRVLSLRGRAVYNAGRPLVLGVLADVTPKAEQGGRVISFPRKTLNYA
jgi:PAS domain S-box-containing protein